MISDNNIQNVKGSFLRQLQERDSVLIADQMQYGFHLDGLEEGTPLGLPDYSVSGFAEGWEIVDSIKLDTVKINKAKKGMPATYDVEGSMVVTTFEEGFYELPPLAVVKVAKDGTMDTLVFDTQTVDVLSMPVDTATYTVHEMKDQIGYPVTFGEVAPYLGGGILLAGLITLIVWLVKRHHKKVVEAAKLDPPHIVALRKLDALRGDKLWKADKQKQFYSAVTDTLREYVNGRYGISAMEMTTAELMDALKDENIPSELKEELKALFERADFVKFAKALSDDEDNARAVPFAVRFVTSTYQAEIEENDVASNKEGK